MVNPTFTHGSDFLFNQQFLPHLEFPLDYHYDITSYVTTSVQSQSIELAEIRFPESFQQLLEL